MLRLDATVCVLLVNIWDINRNKSTYAIVLNQHYINVTEDQNYFLPRSNINVIIY